MCQLIIAAVNGFIASEWKYLSWITLQEEHSVNDRLIDKSSDTEDQEDNFESTEVTILHEKREILVLMKKLILSNGLVHASTYSTSLRNSSVF